MARWKLYIEYQGTRYSGWQIQKNARTVQGEIVRVLAKIFGQTELEFYGAGRTDAGVHALRQVAHLEVASPLEPERLRRTLNDELPPDIHILEIEPAHPRFHARHHAVARSYLYQISTRRTAFGKKLVWWIKEDLDLGAMKAAAGLFEGMQNFRSFAAEDGDDTSAKVLIDKVEIGTAGDLILIRVEGSHFLWKMVRRIVGVLVELGKGRLTLQEVRSFLNASSEEPARLAAPASGLFLERVYYEGDRRLETLSPVLPVESVVRKEPVAAPAEIQGQRDPVRIEKADRTFRRSRAGGFGKKVKDRPVSPPGRKPGRRR
jgi:tRNA pseudouridine38-40 synthase